MASGRPSGANILRGSKKAIRAISRATRSSVSSILARRSSCLAAMTVCFCARKPWINGFPRFSNPIAHAVFGLYPARIAACVALPSTRYSSMNLACFGRSPLTREDVLADFLAAFLGATGATPALRGAVSGLLRFLFGKSVLVWLAPFAWHSCSWPLECWQRAQPALWERLPELVRALRQELQLRGQ